MSPQITMINSRNSSKLEPGRKFPSLDTRFTSGSMFSFASLIILMVGNFSSIEAFADCPERIWRNRTGPQLLNSETSPIRSNTGERKTRPTTDSVISASCHKPRAIRFGFLLPATPLLIIVWGLQEEERITIANSVEHKTFIKLKLRFPMGGLAQCTSLGRIVEKLEDCISCLSAIADWNQESCPAGLNNFPASTDVGGNSWKIHGGGLHQHSRHPFPAGWKQHTIHGYIKSFQIDLHSAKAEGRIQLSFCDQFPEIFGSDNAVRSRDHKTRARMLLANNRNGFDKLPITLFEGQPADYSNHGRTFGYSNVLSRVHSAFHNLSRIEAGQIYAVSRKLEFGFRTDILANGCHQISPVLRKDQMRASNREHLRLDVESTLPYGHRIVEIEAVYGYDASRHLREPRSKLARPIGFGSMGVDQIKSQPAKYPEQMEEGNKVGERIQCRFQRNWNNMNALRPDFGKPGSVRADCSLFVPLFLKVNQLVQKKEANRRVKGSNARDAMLLRMRRLGNPDDFGSEYNCSIVLDR